MHMETHVQSKLKRKALKSWTKKLRKHMIKMRTNELNSRRCKANQVVLNLHKAKPGLNLLESIFGKNFGM